MARQLAALLAAACFLASGSFIPPGAVWAQGTTLKVMDWNIHHGLDTSGANNLDRVVTWIVNAGVHVVSLNEVERRNGYNNNADEPAVLEASLESRTGVPWYGCFAQRTGLADGQGNLVLSRFPLQSCDTLLLGGMRSVARATLSIDGAAIAVFSTHLDDASAAMRATQVGEIVAWAAAAPPNAILMGDFNASAAATELAPLHAGWEDAWAAAAAAGTAVSYAGNTAGNTRNGRIDYIWRFRGATRLSLQGAQVYDTGAISDHRPVSATYTVSPSLTAPQTPAGLRVVR